MSTQHPFQEIFDRIEKLDDKIEEIRQRGLDERGIDKAKYLNLEAAAEFLFIAPATLRGLTQKKKIPFFKQISKLYFKVSDLEAYIEKGKVQPVIKNPNVKQRLTR